MQASRPTDGCRPARGMKIEAKKAKSPPCAAHRERQKRGRVVRPERNGGGQLRRFSNGEGNMHRTKLTRAGLAAAVLFLASAIAGCSTTQKGGGVRL